MAVKKLDLNLLEKITRKQNVKALRRQAREEMRAMKKAGIDFKDLKQLEKNLKNEDWLLSHRNDMMNTIRKEGVIKFDNGVSMNYLKYKTAEQYTKKWNQSVEAWNKRHAEEIKSNPDVKRYKKPFHMGSKLEDQESADAYIENILTNYKTSSDYFQGLWGTYITNINKAITRRTPIGLDFIIDFYKRELPKVVPKTNGDYYQIDNVYTESPEDVLKALKKVADHYGLTQQWNNMIEEHKQEIDDFKRNN